MSLFMGVCSAASSSTEMVGKVHLQRVWLSALDLSIDRETEKLSDSFHALFLIMDE